MLSNSHFTLIVKSSSPIIYIFTSMCEKFLFQCYGSIHVRCQISNADSFLLGVVGAEIHVVVSHVLFDFERSQQTGAKPGF